MPETIYDVAIIGSGPAGYTAAIRAGQLGLKTALIEKDNVLGGTCLHVGCIPTKALLFNAEVFDHVKEGAELGLENTAGVTLNWDAIQKRKQGIVDKHAKGLTFLMRKNKVDVVRGYGKLTGAASGGIHTVALEGGEQKSLKAKNVILSSGSVARMLPGMAADQQILTNIEVLSLKRDSEIADRDRLRSGRASNSPASTNRLAPRSPSWRCCRATFPSKTRKSQRN